MELKKLGEFGLIEKIARSAGAGFPAVIKGIGDDAAVVRSSKTQCQLLTTDTLIEGIHFERALTTPYLLGKKCIAVNLSDIAAMGGTPVCFVVSLSIPPKTPYEFIHQLYKGMIHRARAFAVSLVGGDTTGSRIIWSLLLLCLAQRAPTASSIATGRGLAIEFMLPDPLVMRLSAFCSFSAGKPYPASGR